jgi:hypothetical protein
VANTDFCTCGHIHRDHSGITGQCFVSTCGCNTFENEPTDSEILDAMNNHGQGEEL